MPTYNRVEQLRNCIKSLENQDYPNIVVFIVDNASGDDTEHFCRALVAQDERFRYSRNDRNVGSNKNMEIARQMITEPYFMWLGDDDLISRQYISTCVKRLEADPSMALVSGRIIYHRKEGFGHTTLFQGIPFPRHNSDPKKRFLEVLRTIIDAGGFYGVFRRAAVENIPLVNSWGNDYLFLCEAAYRGRVETQSLVGCFRQDNSADIPISDSMLDSNTPAQQMENPFGAIAALFFWRILHGSTFNELEYEEKLHFALQCLQVIHSRWMVLDEPSMIDLSREIFPNLEIDLELRKLRQPLMSILPQDLEDRDTLPTLNHSIDSLLR